MYDTATEAVNLISYGDINNCRRPAIVRIHSSCIASEVFGARDCDCADQLDESMRLIGEECSGIVIHLHQEGRGQGLSNKIKAVHLMQSQNLDTVEAFDHLNLEHDIREYGLAVDLLKIARITTVRLITNNPRKIEYLQQNGIEVTEVIGISPIIREENREYLYSKNWKLKHQIRLK